MTLSDFSPGDWTAAAIYALIFLTYSWLVERSPWAKYTLSRAMANTRRAWFEACALRELRMPDGQILTMQQNGAAYFGSASLLGIGAGFTLLTAADSLGWLTPVGGSGVIALKALALMLVYALAFFEFTWAFRLFSYNAIALGAIPKVGDGDIRAHVHRACGLNVMAGQRFNRAIRLFLFAIPLLFWLVSFWALLGATATLTLIMFRRQFLTKVHLDALALAWKIQEKP